MQKQLFPLLGSSCPENSGFRNVYVGEEGFLFRYSSMWNSPRQNKIELCSNFIQSLVLPLISYGILSPEFRAGLWLSCHAGQDDRQTQAPGMSPPLFVGSLLQNSCWWVHLFSIYLPHSPWQHSQLWGLPLPPLVLEGPTLGQKL